MDTTIAQRPDLEYRKSLVVLAKSGDHKAFTEYRALNRGLFESMLNRYRKWMPTSAHLDDMRQEGELGLLQGIAHYDPARRPDIKPEGYVYSWVRAYIANYARGHGIGKARRTISENVTPEDSEESVSLFDQIPDPSSDVDMDYRQAEVADICAAVMKKLLPKERVIAARRLFADEPETLEVIGEDLGVSRERIRQVEVKLKSKIRKRMRVTLQEMEIEAPHLAA
jgi:RNA polymerase primary sigma factor